MLPIISLAGGNNYKRVMRRQQHEHVFYIDEGTDVAKTVKNKDGRVEAQLLILSLF